MTLSLFGGSAAIATALITASTLFYTSPLVAEAALASQTTVNQQQEPASAQELKSKPAPAPLSEISLASSGIVAASMPAPVAPAAVPATVDALPAAPPAAPKPTEEVREAPVLVAPQAYLATAYSLSGRTASGRPVGKGIIAADPRVLPLGTRVRLDAGPYSGEYLVADAGSAVKGRKIDVWVPSNREACRFGRRNIKLTVLSYGAKKGARGRK
jgi:3D (Asp-Asp-Asp) domain-containing protein